MNLTSLQPKSCRLPSGRLNPQPTQVNGSPQGFPTRPHTSVRSPGIIGRRAQVSSALQQLCVSPVTVALCVFGYQISGTHAFESGDDFFSGNLTDSNISSYTPPPSAGQSLSEPKLTNYILCSMVVLPMILKLGHFAYQNCKKELLGWINDIMTVFNDDRQENLNGEITSRDQRNLLNQLLSPVTADRLNGVELKGAGLLLDVALIAAYFHHRATDSFNFGPVGLGVMTNAGLRFVSSYISPFQSFSMPDNLPEIQDGTPQLTIENAGFETSFNLRECLQDVVKIALMHVPNIICYTIISMIIHDDSANSENDWSTMVFVFLGIGFSNYLSKGFITDIEKKRQSNNLAPSRLTQPGREQLREFIEAVRGAVANSNPNRTRLGSDTDGEEGVDRYGSDSDSDGGKRPETSNDVSSEEKRSAASNGQGGGATKTSARPPRRESSAAGKVQGGGATKRSASSARKENSPARNDITDDFKAIRNLQLPDNFLQVYNTNINVLSGNRRNAASKSNQQGQQARGQLTVYKIQKDLKREIRQNNVEVKRFQVGEQLFLAKIAKGRQGSSEVCVGIEPWGKFAAALGCDGIKKSALESTFQALAAEEGLSFFTQNRHSIYVGNAFTTVADGNCAFNACALAILSGCTSTQIQKMIDLNLIKRDLTVLLASERQMFEPVGGEPVGKRLKDLFMSATYKDTEENVKILLNLQRILAKSLRQSAVSALEDGHSMEELKGHLRQGAIDFSQNLGRETLDPHDAQFLKYFGVDGIGSLMISIQQPNFNFDTWFDQLGHGFYLNTLGLDGFNANHIAIKYLFDFISFKLSSNGCEISFACRFFDNDGTGNNGRGEVEVYLFNSGEHWMCHKQTARIPDNGEQKV